MKGILEGMKDIEVVEPMITIKSKMKEENIAEFEKLINQF